MSIPVKKNEPSELITIFRDVIKFLEAKNKSDAKVFVGAQAY